MKVMKRGRQNQTKEGKGMTKKDGGPAFPVGSGDMRDPTGMTLRDWFAGMALIPLRDQIGGEDADIATYAYGIADAMITARQLENKEGPCS